MIYKVMDRIANLQHAPVDLTLVKKFLNSSVDRMLALDFNGDSRIVSCKNLAISNRTLSSLRCFSCYYAVLEAIA